MPQLHLAFEHCSCYIENVLIDFSKNVLSAVPFSFKTDAVPYFCNKSCIYTEDYCLSLK